MKDLNSPAVEYTEEQLIRLSDKPASELTPDEQAAVIRGMVRASQALSAKKPAPKNTQPARGIGLEGGGGK